MAPEDVAPALRRITGREPAGWTAVDEGAYSPSRRWLVRWAGGGTAFVKAEPAADDEHGVAVEQRVYAAVTLPCVPRLVAYDAGPPAVLVTEDLSNARWGTPVTAADATALRAALDSLRGVVPPDGLRPLTLRARWAGFAEDPAPLVATGLVDGTWAAAHLPALAEAERRVDPAGGTLVHGDVWLQNWCRDARGVVLVDWAGARVGDEHVSYAWGEAAVRAAGGPPGLVLRDRPEWAAWMAGQAAWFLSRTDPVAFARLAETERREALATLRWACDEVGLPHPVPDARFTALGPWRP